MNFREKRDRFLNLKTSRRALVASLYLLIALGVLSGDLIVSWRLLLFSAALAPASYILWTAKP